MIKQNLKNSLLRLFNDEGIERTLEMIEDMPESEIKFHLLNLYHERINNGTS